MVKFTRLLGEYNAETTTYSAAAGTAQTSPYTPDMDARLIGLRTMEGGGAATSLMNHVQWRLTCTTFRPNTIHVGQDGGGLQTAPRITVPPTDWPCDQEVKSGVPITVEARNVTADTPVTVDTFLYGIFEA